MIRACIKVFVASFMQPTAEYCCRPNDPDDGVALTVKSKGKVIWFTDLSGSGKSTIANALEVALHAQGRRTYLLDGDNVRQRLNKDLGFADFDRVENIRRIVEVARLMMDAGIIVLTAFISPFRREREVASELIKPENFVEVHINTPMAVCKQRDVKGLYKKARNGRLPNMPGIGSPCEPRLKAQITLNGDTAFVEECLHLLMINGICLKTCRDNDLLPISRTSHFSKKSINPENDGHANQANTTKSKSLVF